MGLSIAPRPNLSTVIVTVSPPSGSFQTWYAKMPTWLAKMTRMMPPATTMNL